MGHDRPHASPARKLLAIMFTDIVGYTILMGSNEDQALEILHKNREIHKRFIERHGGKWLKEMGDGILAQFSSALDSVNCALDIQKAIQAGFDYKLRIGIHIGDVTVENGDIFGDGVNIASRIQSIADPGGIYISDSVNKTIKNVSHIQSQYLGEVKLKNVADPVGTYIIKGEYLPVPSAVKVQELTGKSSLDSLMVLPFKNLSGDPNQQYIVDGMQDALIGELSQINALRVISRTSTMRYRDTVKTVPEIASELGIDAIVEATVMKIENMLHIQVQLIRAFPKEEHLWAGSYNREMKNVFALYSEVVKDITKNMEANLTASETKHLEQPYVVIPEAYQAYLRGMFHWEKLSPPDLETALEYFKQTKRIDPHFAPAYSGISGVWIGRMQMGFVPPDKAIPNIYEYIQKTRNLDENIADLHFWKAIMSVWVEWDWIKGVNEFEAAINLNSNHALSAAYYSHLLLILGHVDESNHQIEKAIELDPFNPLILGLYGMQLSYARKYDKAIEVVTSILNDVQSHPIALTTLRSAFHNKKMYDRAYEFFMRYYIEKGDSVAANIFDTGFKEGGYHMALKRTAELLIARSDASYVPAWQIATLYTRAGLRGEAIQYLENAYQIRDPNMPYINVDPIFDDLKEEPGFQELVQKMNFVVKSQ